MQFKQMARNWVYPAILKIPSEWLKSAFHFPEGLSLCFHGVTEKDYTAITGRHMVLPQFELLVRYLSANFHCVDEDTFFSTYPKPDSRPRICIGFDDGFLNNYKTALSVLERYQVPGAFYLSTLNKDNSNAMLWADIFELVIFHYKPASIEIEDQLFSRNSSYRNSQNAHITDWIKNMKPEARDSWLVDFSAKFQLTQLQKTYPEELWRLMHAEEWQKFAKSPFVKIGSHTHHHYNLENIEPEVAEIELLLSKNLLENATDKKINSIAYPDGSYNSTVKDLAEKAGYSLQWAVAYKLDGDQTDSRIKSRFGISNTTTWQGNILKMLKDGKKTGSQ